MLHSVAYLRLIMRTIDSKATVEALSLSWSNSTTSLFCCLGTSHTVPTQSTTRIRNQVQTELMSTLMVLILMPTSATYYFAVSNFVISVRSSNLFNSETLELELYKLCPAAYSVDMHG